MFDTVHTAYPVIGLILYGTSKICTKLRDKFLSASLNSFDSILQRLSQKWIISNICRNDPQNKFLFSKHCHWF